MYVYTYVCASVSNELVLRILSSEEGHVQNELGEDTADAPHVHRLAVDQAVAQLLRAVSLSINYLTYTHTRHS